MKKFAAIVLSLALVAGMFTGCAKKPAAGMELKEGQTVETVVEKINTDIGIAMASPVDETLLKDLFYISAADTDAYYGLMSMVNVNADNVIAVKAKAGKKDTVVEGLNKRLKDMQNTFATYLPDQYEKTQKGRVVEKGDYVFLLILGESSETFDADMEKAVKIIDEAF